VVVRSDEGTACLSVDGGFSHGIGVEVGPMDGQIIRTEKAASVVERSTAG
jgi:hypothetical protein